MTHKKQKLQAMKANLPYYIYKISHILYKYKIPFIPFFLKQFLRIVFSAVIPYECVIGKNVHFGFNGLGIVIHRKCIIGNNVHIYHQVTLGRWDEEKLPVIGDNVVIGSGAKIIGNVKIGNNAKIGANAVVLKDVPPDCTAVGVPARIIQKS